MLTILLMLVYLWHFAAWGIFTHQSDINKVLDYHSKSKWKEWSGDDESYQETGLCWMRELVLDCGDCARACTRLAWEWCRYRRLYQTGSESDAGIRLASWLVVNVMQVSELVADTSSSDAGIRACSRLASWLEVLDAGIRACSRLASWIVLDAGIRAISRDLATVPLYQFQPPTRTDLY